MIFKNNKILLWIFIGLLSLGQFQRVELSGNLSGINIYYHDFFIFFWLVNFALTYALGNEKFSSFMRKTSIKKIVKSLKLEIAFMSIATVGIILNLIIYKDVISVLYLARFISYILFAFTLRHLIRLKKLSSTDLRFKLFGAGAIILLLGFLQLITIKDTRFLAILGWDDHFHRLISSIFDPGFTGIILVISYFFFLSLKKITTNKIVNEIVALSFFWGIALTFSRASYLALILSLVMLSIIKKKTISKTLLKISIFIVMILLVPKPGGEGVDLARTSSIDARSLTIQQEIKLLNPETLVIGNGLFSEKNSLSNQANNAANVPSHSRMPDNFFVNILLSTGIFGTILIILIIIKWIVKIIKIDPEIGAAIIALLIHSQFNNSIFQPFVLLILLGGIASIKTNSLKLKVKN